MENVRYNLNTYFLLNSFEELSKDFSKPKMKEKLKNIGKESTEMEFKVAETRWRCMFKILQITKISMNQKGTNRIEVTGVRVQIYLEKAELN